MRSVEVKARNMGIMLMKRKSTGEYCTRGEACSVLLFQRETDCSCHPSTNILKSLLSTPKTRHTISKEQCLPHYCYHISCSSRSPGVALSTSISLPSSSCSSKGCYWITGAQYSFLINVPRCNTFFIRRAWSMGSVTHPSDPPCSN